MYRVVKLYGDCEPWWFLDASWEEDVIASQVFQNYDEALSYYQKEWVLLSERLPEKRSKNGLMTTFWNPKDLHWCEECDEYLQYYHSLMLIECGESLPPAFRKKSAGKRVRPCQFKQKQA
ncbi:DUF1033 family protein [Streptococcus oriscaviae]|uniref:DUF1033 family protein n=1 Tax=Streptococcus oriscaviae TaxID=2781599 RepID=A0ABX7YI56_9STRE|nr:DUF1033 family protein [Streptococcus oriscaviae]QUE53476.1 DUF1033 family protein [Streptococcus oriscaviae]